MRHIVLSLFLAAAFSTGAYFGMDRKMPVVGPALEGPVQPAGGSCGTCD